MNAHCWVNRTDVTHSHFFSKENGIHFMVPFIINIIMVLPFCLNLAWCLGDCKGDSLDHYRWRYPSLKSSERQIYPIWRSLNPPPETPLKPFIRVRNCLLKTYFCQETSFSLREKKEVETSHAAFTLRLIHGYEQHRYYPKCIHSTALGTKPGCIIRKNKWLQRAHSNFEYLEVTGLHTQDMLCLRKLLISEKNQSHVKSWTYLYRLLVRKRTNKLWGDKHSDAQVHLS